jgi:hypothetical protein
MQRYTLQQELNLDVLQAQVCLAWLRVGGYGIFNL